MKILFVIGSKDITDRKFVMKLLDYVVEEDNFIPDLVLTTGEKGVGWIAEQWAMFNQYHVLREYNNRKFTLKNHIKYGFKLDEKTLQIGYIDSNVT